MAPPDCLQARIDLAAFLVGLTFACVGNFPIRRFYDWVCARSGLPHADETLPRVPHIIIGTFERVLAFLITFFATGSEQVGVVLLAWMTAKLAANWQRREQADRVRARTLIALMTGTLSLGWGVVGGMIAKCGPSTLVSGAEYPVDLTTTIEEFEGDGFTHIECHCPRCRVTRLRRMSWLPRISMGLTIAQLSERLRCADCGGSVQSVKPWRLEDVLGKPLGRRG